MKDEQKEALRALVRGRLRRLSPAQMAEESARCCARLCAADFFARADAVLCYVPLPREVDVRAAALAALGQGKAVAVPRTVPGTALMDFYVLAAGLPLDSQLEAGQWGIREPLPRLPRFAPAAGSAVCAVVPGVAFTAGGLRLGRGRGYYDRYLPRLRGAAGSLTLAGVCFGCQLVEELPVDGHDVRMDAVIHG